MSTTPSIPILHYSQVSPFLVILHLSPLHLLCYIHIYLLCKLIMSFFFFFQAEDGIRDYKVTGVQTCALPISVFIDAPASHSALDRQLLEVFCANLRTLLHNRGLLERLHQSAYFDPLVCLPNRAHFVEKVDECVWRGTRDHVLALVDIDDFTATNDVMGHRFGDRLLEAMARRSTTALPAGVLLARVGSDTFGILGPTDEVALAQLLDCARQDRKST